MSLDDVKEEEGQVQGEPELKDEGPFKAEFEREDLLDS
ncbi:type III secretory pathway component EscU [Peribacillus huizhouensis]|uniref:Type III secretory pathway component EscU n=1 Tax=Peribacillus huizhouensis TaxID=1501239 RepID=A0ABR6CI81_9BACI|nr:type III secretory pathway component EscU [Peribacillus huizhouensis]